MAEQRAITEREVRRLAREGAKLIDIRGAIVTPGARNAARELGVLFTGPDVPTAVQPMRAYGSFDPRPAEHFSVALGCDGAGAPVKESVAARLYEMQHEVRDLAAARSSAMDSPDAAVAVAREVASGRARFGIVVDGTGVGACIAANKIAGVRAAACHDVTSAASAREQCDANLLCLAGGLIGPRLAVAIVETFLSRELSAKYEARVAKLKALDG